MQIPKKNISNRDVFSKITAEEFVKSKKLLQILRKLLDPQITLLTIRKYFANPQKLFQIAIFVQIIIEESVKSKKTIANPKKLIGSANNFLKKLEYSLQSKNRREIQKNIFKIVKYVLPRAVCASRQPALDVFPPSSVSKMAKKRDKNIKCDVLP